MTGWRSSLVAAVLLLGLGAPAAAAAEGDGEPLFAFADREIAESSGLVDAGDVVHTVNDSGSGPVLYTVDVSTGATTGRTTYTDGEVVDVEALAPGRDRTVWVGDIGDNGASRDSVSLYRVRPGQAGAARLDLTYPDGPRDAEALLAHPRTGRLFVVSKTVFGGVVHAAPRRLVAGEVHRLTPFARVPGLLTDGAFLPDGEHVLLRGYAAATLFTFPAFEVVGSFPLPRQRQGEGLAVGRDGRVLLSSEGVGQEVLEVELPRADVSPTAGATPDQAGEDRSAARPDPERIGASEAPWGWWAAGALGLGVLAAVLLLLGQRRRD
jgi:hypothetical protein